MAPFDKVLDAAIAHGEAIIDRLQEAARVRAADYKYGWHTIRDLAQVAGSGATLWLLYKHKRLAMPVSVATAAVTAGLSVAAAKLDPLPPKSEGLAPQEVLRDKIVNAIMDMLPNVAGALSICLNPTARASLNQPMHLMPRNPAVPFTVGEHARNAVSLYAAYTMVGHWLEMVFCHLIRLGVVDGEYDRSNTMLWDWWLHPFPAEGIAGLMIAGVLSPLREKLLQGFGGRIAPALGISFLVNQVVCTAIDYLTGMVANRNYELWDYRNMPFNFQGQVCLQNSLVYTTAATLVAWLIYPARDKLLRRIPADVTNLGFCTLLPAHIFVNLLYFV